MTIDEALAMIGLQADSLYSARTIAERLYYTTMSVYSALRRKELDQAPDCDGVRITGKMAADWGIRTGRIDLIKRIRNGAETR